MKALERENKSRETFWDHLGFELKMSDALATKSLDWHVMEARLFIAAQARGSNLFQLSPFATLPMTSGDTGIAGLGRLTVQAHCLSHASSHHSPPMLTILISHTALAITSRKHVTKHFRVAKKYCAQWQLNGSWCLTYNLCAIFTGSTQHDNCAIVTVNIIKTLVPSFSHFWVPSTTDHSFAIQTQKITKKKRRYLQLIYCRDINCKRSIDKLSSVFP